MLTASNYREIHLSDLIRAHEGNPDFHDEDPNKIHWAKFNMMGRFIDAITQCQAGCRETGTFNFQPKPQVRALLMFDQPQYLMDEEVGRWYQGEHSKGISEEAPGWLKTTKFELVYKVERRDVSPENCLEVPKVLLLLEFEKERLETIRKQNLAWRRRSQRSSL